MGEPGSRPRCRHAGRVERRPRNRSHEALDGTEALLEAPGYVRALAPPALDLEPDARVHIVATNIRVGDAIGNLALDALRALRLHGFDTRLYAREMGPELWGVAEPVESLSKHARAGDLVFYQYSVADPDLGVVLDSPAAKVCFYHGVTPARFFKAQDSDMAAACRAGEAGLPRLEGFDGLIAATSFTAAELRAAVGESRRVHLVPPTLNLARFAEVDAAYRRP
ncbi:MAG: hypothetical protein JRG83_20760 [Deltaproteobacteria bacterium]|nr:hypothetical protein [Deltaproteobacteria bacterium]